MADDIVGRFDSIRIFAKDRKLAPHKPLLLLYALAEFRNRNSERIEFNDAEKTVGPLIRQYASRNTKARVADPFGRLANDKGNIWWIEPHQTNVSGDLSSIEARDQHLKAGFSDDVLAAFRQNPALIDDVAINLLERNFSPSLHHDILDAVGLFLDVDKVDKWESVMRRRRNPTFRPNVLNAYREQCCVCKCDIKMNGAAVALEAGHIKMHSAGGPDDVKNGLALCVIHHKLFDIGALTVDMDIKMHVSEKVKGDWGRRLYDEYHEQPILKPRNENMIPAEEFLRWHNERIFKGLVL